MSPPSDGARPARWIVNNAVFYDEPSAISYAATLVASATCNPTVFPVYTAADYDALRAEVERLTKDYRVAADLAKQSQDLALQQCARAEVAEAKVGTVRSAASKLVEKAQQHNNVISTVFTKHVDLLRAALNEGDGE